MSMDVACLIRAIAARDSRHVGRGPAFALSLLLGCAASPPERSPSPVSRPPPAPLPAPPSFPIEPPLPPPSAAVARLVPQLAQAYDYRHWAAGLLSLGAWEPHVPRPRSGTFIFLRGFDRSKRYPLTTGMAGAGTVFNEDGSLSPSVVLPAYPVLGRDGATLERLLAVPGTEGWPSFDPAHHVFVTFSAEGTRQIAVSFEGRRLYGLAVQGTKPEPEVLEGLRAICRRSGAPLCDLDADTATDARAHWWAQERERTLQGTWRRRSRPLLIDGERTPASLSARERGLACLWNLEHVVGLLEPRPDWFGIVGDHWVRLHPWARCVETFPSCSVALEELVPCMEVAQKGDLWLRLTEAGRQCLPKRACLWGFAWADGPVPRSEPEPARR